VILRPVELDPDDDLFAGWCEVWAAAQRADRPGDPPRPAIEHAVRGRQLLASGGSSDGTHRAAVVDGAVAGAPGLNVPLKDNPTVVVVDVAVHPAHRRRGIGSALLDEGATLAAARGRARLVVEVDEPGPRTPGRAFALRHGWTCDLVGDPAGPPGAAGRGATVSRRGRGGEGERHSGRSRPARWSGARTAGTGWGPG
jgi:ribosomal protein S18 acetylase RimI-like enzyme